MDAGRAYIFWGPDLTTSVTLTSPFPATKGYLGERLGIVDIDGDGFGDVCVGIDKAVVSGFTNAGKVEVYWGPDLQAVTEVFDPAPEPDTWFGDRPATGDVTGDGVDDLVVACPRANVGSTLNVGRIFVFTSGRSLSLFKVIENPLPAGINSRFGNGIDGMVDFDGDGRAEIVTSDQRDHAYIFWSPTLTEHTVIDRPPSWFVQPEDSVSYGYVVAAGDLNGDGWIDVAIGDPFSGVLSGCSLARGGAVFVAMGPYYGTHHVLIDPTPQCYTEFGWSLAIGDLTGDLRNELVIGNDYAEVGGISSGKAVLLRRP